VNGAVVSAASALSVAFRVAAPVAVLSVYRRPLEATAYNRPSAGRKSMPSRVSLPCRPEIATLVRTVAGASRLNETSLWLAVTAKTSPALRAGVSGTGGVTGCW